ncbi:MAG TPA: TonB-dependent receptor, partial [Pseudoxanthomonas sp.]|nr:TonB-dependent receptor [Pseudoxanthomonas sp.]
IATTYNGRDIFTAERRYVAVQDFPAGGVSALQVYKSTTADLAEGGIAGLINVQSRRPFDFDGAELAGGLRYTYTNQAEEYDPNWNLLASNRWQLGDGEFGALINISETRLTYLDSVRFNDGFISAIWGRQVADPSLLRARLPYSVGIFQSNAERSRPSINAALQWRPNDRLELYSDFLYQGYRVKVSDRQLSVPLFGGGREFSNVVLRPGTNQVQSLTYTGEGRPQTVQDASENDADTYQLAIGGIWTSDAWRISMDIARTESEYDFSVYSYSTAFTRSPTVNVNFDVPREDGGAEFSFENFNTLDPANFVYYRLYDRHLLAKGDDIQFRTDFEYSTTLPVFTKFQFGVRYVDRDASFGNGERSTRSEGIALTSTPLELTLNPGGFNGSDVQATRRWVTSTWGSIRDNIEALRQGAGSAAGAPPFDPTESLRANEKSRAAYAQFRYDFGSDLPIDGVVGLRVVKTEHTVTGTGATLGGGTPLPFPFIPPPPSFIPVTEQSEYTDYLPTASMRVRFNDTLQLRLSGNKTRTRPNFSQLNPRLVTFLTDVAAFAYASGGNINLKPIESTNYDISLENYFSATSFASVVLFRREIQGFIADQTTVVAYRVYGLLNVTRPVNLSESTLQGVEAQLTTFFDYDFMPQWAHGFGLQVNGTYIENKNALPLVSKNSYNLVGIYEQGPVSVRLAYNTRNRFLNEACIAVPGPNVFNPGCEYTEDVSRLDLSANWTPIENLTLTFDVSNILGEPLRTFRNYQDPNGSILGTFPRDVRFEETVYSLGLRFRY